jgi:hypothetical protein
LDTRSFLHIIFTKESEADMLNEGLITGDQRTLIKSEMVRHLHAVGRTTTGDWERAVFTALTDHDRDEIDWEVPDNKAGYYLWIKAFDQLVEELVEDGYARVVAEGEHPLIASVERDDDVRYSEGIAPA